LRAWALLAQLVLLAVLLVLALLQQAAWWP
jgi:hypothetical protein